MTWTPTYNKQLLDEVFVICGIIKVEVSVFNRAEGKADNTYRDLDNSAYSRFKIQELYLTTVKTHQDTYYKQLHKQNYKYKKKYIYICYIGKPAFHECRGDKSLCDISTAASFELP